MLGGNATTGAVSTAAGELGAKYLAEHFYQKDVKDLTETERQQIKEAAKALAGIAGGLTAAGKDASAVKILRESAVGATVTKNAVENNYLYINEAEEKAILDRKIRDGIATEKDFARRNELDKVDEQRDLEIIVACSNGVSNSDCLNLASQAEYAKLGYEKYMTYNLQYKDLYSKDYANVENILKGKDANSVEFERIAIALSKSQNMTLDEAKTTLNRIYAYKSFAELVGALRAGTVIKYPSTYKATTAPTNYEKIIFNGLELHPDLPPPKAGYDFVPQKAKGNSIHQQWKDINGYRGEINLANNVSASGRVVVKWGDAVGSNGSDIISVNPKTGTVELWDNKYRSRPTKGVESPTFSNERTRNAAIEEAIKEIDGSKNLSPKIREKAIFNLSNGNFTTHTVGSGKVKSSVTQNYCNNQKCL